MRWRFAKASRLAGLLTAALLFIGESVFAAPSKWPVPSSRKISGVYGDWRDDPAFRFHPSADIEGAVGSVVIAVEAGTVRPEFLQQVGSIDEQLIVQVSPTQTQWYTHILVTDTIKTALLSGATTVAVGQVIGSIRSHPTINHLDFGVHGPNIFGDISALENPLNNGVLGSLAESADATKPTVESIHLKADDGGATGFIDLTASPPVIAGRIDVIPKMFDDNGASLKAGIWRIGYAVKDNAGSFVLGTPATPVRFLFDEFTNALPPATQQALDTVYSRTDPISHFHTEGGRYSYIVTNKKAGALDKAGVWATQAKSGAATDGSGTDALAVEDAVVKDGRNSVVIIAQDRKGNTNTLDASSEKAVIVDNFRPFLRRTAIRETAESGGILKFLREWLFGGSKYESPAPNPAAPISAGSFTIELEFSEPVVNPALSIDTLGPLVLNSADSSGRVFTAALEVGGASPIQDGERTMTITAKDLGGNDLLAVAANDTSIDPATQLIRNVSGMQGVGGSALVSFKVDHTKISVFDADFFEVQPHAWAAPPLLILAENVRAGIASIGLHKIGGDGGPYDQVVPIADGPHSAFASFPVGDEVIPSGEYIAVVTDVNGETRAPFSFKIDSDPPELISRYPEVNQVIPPDNRRPEIRVALNEEHSGFIEESIQLYLEGRQLAAEISGEDAERHLVFTPETDLDLGVNHQLTVLAADVAGNELVEEWGFTLATDEAPPLVKILEASTFPLSPPGGEHGPFTGLNTAPLWLHNSIIEQHGLVGLTFAAEDEPAGVAAVVIESGDGTTRLQVGYPRGSPFADLKAIVLPDAPVGGANQGSENVPQSYSVGFQDWLGNATTVQFNVDSTPPKLDVKIEVDKTGEVRVVGNADDDGSGAFWADVLWPGDQGPLPAPGSPRLPRLKPIHHLLSGWEVLGDDRQALIVEPQRMVMAADASGLRNDFNPIQLIRTRRQEFAPEGQPAGVWFPAPHATGWATRIIKAGISAEGVTVKARCKKDSDLENPPPERIPLKYAGITCGEEVTLGSGLGTHTPDVMMGPGLELMYSGGEWNSWALDIEMLDGNATFNPETLIADVGRDVVVGFQETTITLPNVLASFDRRISVMDRARIPRPPEGMRTPPNAVPGEGFGITNLSEIQGNPIIERSYDPSGMTSEQQDQLQLWHFDEATGRWHNITTGVDVPNHKIKGVTPSFSLFAVFIPTAAFPPDTVPPATALTHETPTFTDSQGRLYARGPAAARLSATDNDLGVAAIYFSVDPSSGVLTAGLSSSTARLFQRYAAPIPLAEGVRTLAYGAADRAANFESLQVAEVRVDATAPLVDVVAGGTRTAELLELDAGSPIALAAHDPETSGAASGVAQILYLVDVSPEECESAPERCANPVYTEPFTLSVGTHTLYFAAVDNVGNGQNAISSIAVSVRQSGDVLPPVTVLSMGQPQAAGAETVFISTATPLFLTSRDDGLAEGDGLGVGTALQRLAVDSEDRTLFVNPEPIPGDLFVSTFALAADQEGGHLLSFFAEDALGRRESTRTAHVTLDRAPPSTSLLIGEPRVELAGGVLIGPLTPLTLDATDQFSGVASTYLRTSTNAAFAVQSATFSLTAGGASRLEFFSVDRVGNAEPSVAREVTVDGAPPQLALLSPSPESQGAARIVNGAFPVFAAVSDPHLRDWRLEAAGSGQTILIASGSAPADGAVGAWDTSGLSGWWTLQLSAVDLVGNAATTAATVFVGQPRVALAVSGFNKPHGVAVAADGALHVADRNNDRVASLSAAGVFAGQLQGFNKPEGVAVDGAGHVYVADRNNDRVLKLSPDGAALLQLGGGRGKPAFNKPSAVALDGGGRILVADRNNKRVQVYDAAGTAAVSIRLDREGKPSAVVADAQDRIYVGDEENGRVLLYDASGVLLKTFERGLVGLPGGLAAGGSDGSLWISDQEGGRILRLDRYGHAQAVFSGFNKPRGLALSPAGDLALAERDADRVVVLSLPGQPTATVSAPPGQAKRLVEKDRGGKVERADKAAVILPPFAAPQDLEITVSSAPADEMERKVRMAEERLKSVSPPVEYGPEGTKFVVPVTLVLPYDAALLSAHGIREAELKVHYWNPESKDWEPLDSTVDPISRTVSARTDHFSLYQAMAPPAVPAAATESFALREIYSYPNPARPGQRPAFHVDVGAADSINLRLYDVSGKLVLQAAPAVGQDYVWDVSGVGSGVYYYVVTAKKAGHADLQKRGKVAVIK